MSGRRGTWWPPTAPSSRKWKGVSRSFSSARAWVDESAVTSPTRSAPKGSSPWSASAIGSDKLPTNGIAYGRYIGLYGLNTRHTLLTSGMSMTVSASTTITMWLPRGEFTPTLLEFDAQESMTPFRSGYVSQFQLDPVSADSAISLALPAFTKISGTVSDPNHVLAPMQMVGNAGNSPPHYYHCNTLDYGSYPDPIFLFPEGSVSDFFTAATSHAFYARKGMTCVAYANYAIAVGPGGLSTRAGENTYAYMQDPTPRSPDAITLGDDVVRDVSVPALGTQITVRGTVKDVRGNGLANINLSFVSDALTNAGLSDKMYVGGVDSTAAGEYVLHALPGTYLYTAELPASESTAATLDAGAPKDASADLPVIIPSTGDAGSYTCATLAACCNNLGATDKATCQAVVAMNNDGTCSTLQTMLALGGSCP
jgi:hypothetical protein